MIRSSKPAVAVALLLALGACAGSSTASPAPPSPSPALGTPGCIAREAAEFDFWVGSWTGTWTDAQGTATASDIVINAGCEIDEKFTAARFLGHDRYSATSRSHWDLVLGKWVQDYRDSVGERSRWLGGFANGAMTLVGPQVGGRQQRVIWRDIRSDGWTWEYDSSADGQTWSALVVVSYRRA